MQDRRMKGAAVNLGRAQKEGTLGTR